MPRNNTPVTPTETAILATLRHAALPGACPAASARRVAGLPRRARGRVCAWALHRAVGILLHSGRRSFALGHAADAPTGDERRVLDIVSHLRAGEAADAASQAEWLVPASVRGSFLRALEQVAESFEAPNRQAA